MTKRPTKPTATKVERPSAPTKSQPSQPSAAKSKPATKQKPDRKAAKVGASSPPKLGRVVAMLERKEGATVVAVMKATGWQKHSVHGFFAGVVRKKLGLNLVSEKKDGAQVYRIVEGKTGKAPSSVRKRAA